MSKAIKFSHDIATKVRQQRDEIAMLRGLIAKHNEDCELVCTTKRAKRVECQQLKADEIKSLACLGCARWLKINLPEPKQ